MSRGAVLGVAPDMAVFGGGDCQEAFAAVLEEEPRAEDAKGAKVKSESRYFIRPAPDHKGEAL